jgi:glycosyltransferase involved in cell wall biosynthesis
MTARDEPEGNSPQRSIALVVPVFNDWESLEILLKALNAALSGSAVQVSVLVVDDGSTERPRLSADLVGGGFALRSLDVMHLPFNMGHQRAIALGLAEVAAGVDCDAVLIMDADGEDRPEDVPRLIAAHLSAPDSIVVAQRTKRSEGLVFKTLYSVYKRIFRVLTGNWIDFGNFSLIPRAALDRLVDMPETWNHLAATYVRTPVPLVTLPTERGSRYRGQSRMNLPNLVFHAICAMSVFADILFARILIGTSALAVFSIALMSVVLGIHLFTDWSIPGWTSNVVGLLSVFLVQLLILMLGAAFLMVNHRSNMSGSPASHHRRMADDLRLAGVSERVLRRAAR